MEKNEILELVAAVPGKQNANGFWQEERLFSREVFCTVKSAGRQEFYEAARSGMKASIIFVVDRDDFDESSVCLEGGRKVKPSRVIQGGDSYRIIRTYRTPDGDMELTCEEIEPWWDTGTEPAIRAGEKEREGQDGSF